MDVSVDISLESASAAALFTFVTHAPPTLKSRSMGSGGHDFLELGFERQLPPRLAGGRKVLIERG